MSAAIQGTVTMFRYDRFTSLFVFTSLVHYSIVLVDNCMHFLGLNMLFLHTTLKEDDELLSFLSESEARSILAAA